MIRFSCPMCGAAMRAAPGAEGRTCRCVKCSSSITIPNASPATQAAEYNPFAFDDAAPEPSTGAVEPPDQFSAFSKHLPATKPSQPAPGVDAVQVAKTTAAVGCVSVYAVLIVFAFVGMIGFPLVGIALGGPCGGVCGLCFAAVGLYSVATLPQAIAGILGINPK